MGRGSMRVLLGCGRSTNRDQALLTDRESAQASNEGMSNSLLELKSSLQTVAGGSNAGSPSALLIKSIFLPLLTTGHPSFHSIFAKKVSLPNVESQVDTISNSFFPSLGLTARNTTHQSPLGASTRSIWPVFWISGWSELNSMGLMLFGPGS